ncbi:hypothetical protein GCK32_008476 [Trichostrongylus colubriformis]|uniref:Histone acetyltransferase n=1 Tax=Trichostrongylus colubriformis TaxID=6319 RepID=A0AAN8FUV6_TRICO
MARLRFSHVDTANASTNRTGRSRKPRMKKAAVKRKVGRSIGSARRTATGKKSSKRFIGVRMPRIKKVRGGNGPRKSGQSANTPPYRSPHGKLSPIKTRRLQKSKQLNVSRCTICKTSEDHLSKCILYCPSMVSRVTQVDWLCPKCIRCSTCQLMIDDPTNVECANCLRAWHGACKPTNCAEMDRQWFCNTCLKGVNQPRRLANSGSQKARRSSENLSKPTLSMASSSLLIEPDSETPRRKRGRPKGNRKMDEVAVHDISLPSTSSLPEDASPEEVKAAGDPPKFLLSPHKMRKNLSSSPEKKSVMTEQPEFCSSSIGGKLFDVLYESPYADDIKSVPLFFICAFCLKPFSDQNSFFVHQDCCPRIAPPGREIYRDSNSSLSFFEVDGAEERTYCRYLCLLAMLFISSKTSHNEVATFLFYILTKNDENGCRIVGYFSKEKNPSRNNNLSCLLTIPSEQRNGYGHLLIDMSYQLSCIERKVGSPEHPLSDLGLFTYRKYWKSRKDSTNISIKSMSLQTRIHPTDIVNELMRNNLLVMKDGNYFIKTWKLAFKFPLSMLRRRVVDPTRIKWTPSFDKLSSYQIRLSDCETREEDFDAARSCVAIEEEVLRWGRWSPSRNYSFTATGHIATVDALRLFPHRSSGNRFCLSGGRDRAIKLWNISELEGSHQTTSAIKPCFDLQNAHEGWIWCLDQSASKLDEFLSCSWDCTVKLWQITPTHITLTESTKLGSAGMCLGNSPNGLAACSTFGKKVFIIDTKNGLAPVLNYAHHKGAVLTLAMQDNIVYSCGEDRRIVMVDIRNSSKPVSGLWSIDYVRSVYLQNNHLICGTHLGMISVLDPHTLDVCSRFQVSNGVRQVIHSGGAILEISRDRTFKAFTVGVRSSIMAELSFDCDPCRFDYRDGDLAIGAGDGSILLWTDNSSLRDG